MKLKLTLLLLFAGTMLHAQKFNKIYEHKIDVPFYKLFEGGDMDFHISNSGEHVVIGTDDWIKVLDGSGQLLFKQECINKSNKKSNLLGDVVGGEAGALISNVKLNEGTGFWIFEDQGVIVLLDWNFDKNILIGYDLNSGEKLWETDQYRYTPGEDKQIASILAATVASAVAYETFSAASIITAEAFNEIQYDMATVDGYGSQRARAFITPMGASGQFLLTNEKGFTSLNISDGAENWTYDNPSFKIGQYLKVPGQDEIILINNSPNFLGGSGKKLMVKINSNSGEVLFEKEHSAKFFPNRTYIIDNKLVLDYWGAEVFDVTTGEKLFATADEKAMTRRLAFLPDEFVPPPVWIENDVMYAGHSKISGLQYPNLPTMKKPQFSAFDFNTGDKIWTTDDKYKKTTEIKEVAKERVILNRDGGFNKIFFMSLSKEDGSVVQDEQKFKVTLFGGGHDDEAFFITDQHIVTHDGTKIMHMIDKETLKESKKINTKDAKIGNMMSMDVLRDKMLVIGEKGVAFYDKTSGDLLGATKINDIVSGVWNEDNLMLFTEKGRDEAVVVFNLASEQITDTRELKDLVIMSPDLKHWVMVDKKRDTDIDFFAIKE